MVLKVTFSRVLEGLRRDPNQITYYHLPQERNLYTHWFVLSTM